MEVFTFRIVLRYGSSFQLFQRLALSAQGGKQIVWVGIIAKGFTYVSKAIGVARTKNKAAAELKRVLAQAMLTNPDRFRAFPGTGVIGAKEMKQVGVFQRNGSVSFALIINQEGKSDTRFLAEMAGVARVAETYGCQFGATLFELLLVLAQPRDMLAAEDSAIVAQKYDHSSGIGPERTQAYRFPVDIWQRNVCKLAAVVCGHGRLFSTSWGGSVNTEPRFIPSGRLC